MCGDILKTSKDAEALIKAKHGTTYVVLHVIYLHCLFGILGTCLPFLYYYQAITFIYIFKQCIWKREHIKINVMFLKCEWFIVLNNLTTIVGFILHLAIYGENDFKHFIFFVSL